MKRSFTIEDIKNSAAGKINAHLFIETAPAPRKSKYGNKKTVVNSIQFDSIKEANYYKTLLLLLKAGKIGMLELQVKYDLNPGGTHKLTYVADFRHVDMETGETVVTDVKGFRTREYLKKRRLLKKIYQITIKEI